MSHSEQPCCNVATGQIQNKSRTQELHTVLLLLVPHFRGVSVTGSRTGTSVDKITPGRMICGG